MYSKMFSRWTASIIVLLMSIASSTTSSVAAEGGASNYIPGGYGNFGVAIAPAPGFYFQNDVFYYSGDASVSALSGNRSASLETEVYVEMMTGLWATEHKVFGAQYATGVILPVVSAELSGTITAGPLAGSASGSRSGLGDMGFIPASLYWTLSPNFHVNLAEIIIAPTGDYSTSRLLNMGRNYWSFDTVLSATYMTDTGTEFSAVAGFMLNTENPDTNYQTGSEFHLDWMVNQFFSETFALGVQGYVYRQISGDSGSGATLGDFKGSANGIGGAIMWVPIINERPVKLVAKVMHEFGVERRFKGTWGQFQFGFKF